MQNELDGKREFVTPEMAAEWLITRAYPLQRDYEPDFGEQYARYMAMGLWRRSTLRFDCLGKEIYTVDGQHRLHAVKMAKTGQWFDAQYTLCESMDEVDFDYSITDQGRGRTRAQQRSALRLPELLGLSKVHVDAVLRAVGIIVSGFDLDYPGDDGTASDKTMRTIAARELKESARAYFDAVARPDRAIGALQMQHSVLVAAGIVTSREQPLKAADFWQNVARFKGADDSATHALAKLLASKRFYRTRRVIEFSRCVAQSWNHHYKGTPLLSIRPRESEIAAPIRFEGTQYNGQNVVRYIPPDWAEVVSRIHREREEDERR